MTNDVKTSLMQFVRIDMTKLRKDLCGSDKMPLDFSMEPTSVEVQCVSRSYGTSECEPVSLTLKVLKTQERTDGKKTSKHRIYVMCSCRKWIPLGRLKQHLRQTREHV